MCVLCHITKSLKQNKNGVFLSQIKKQQKKDIITLTQKPKNNIIINKVLKIRQFKRKP